MLSLYNNQCVEYNGVCAQYLPRLDNGSSVFTLTHNTVSEVDIKNIQRLLKWASQECRDAVLPFVCQYAFPPCDIASSNVSIISGSQCSYIRDVVCPNEWNLAIRVSASAASLLPNCETFYDIDEDNNTLPTATTVSQPLQCHYQFKEFCGLCLPLCGKFSQYRVQTKFQERGILIFAGTAGFVGGILVFIVSAYRRKAM